MNKQLSILYPNAHARRFEVLDSLEDFARANAAYRQQLANLVD